jgi:hypothetical protein
LQLLERSCLGVSLDDLQIFPATFCGDVEVGGNVVWVCEKCNGDKGESEWAAYVRSISINEEQAEGRIARVEGFRQHYGYEVSDEMRSLAQSLHRGVTTLINEKVRIAEALTA